MKGLTSATTPTQNTVTTPLLRDEYRINQTTRVTAIDLDTLASKLDGVNRKNLLNTVREFNASIHENAEFNPAIKDGRSTRGLRIPKSNWAMRIEKPPFEAFAVTCGITFTFGGIRINREGQVLDESDYPMEGLYAAGEMVGGFFYFNYPGWFSVNREATSKCTFP